VDHAAAPPTFNKRQQALALLSLIVGFACPFVFILSMPSGPLEVPFPPLVVMLLCVLGLDLFVGVSSTLVTSQRITPAVVLALLLTPGIPAALALIVDLIGAISVAATARLNYAVLGHAGRCLVPATLTAFYLQTRQNHDAETYFFACWVFVVVSLITRTEQPPFRSDVFLVISYPAVALLLRYLIELNLTYVLLAVPLLFLLTTVETGTLQRFFALKKKLAESQSEIRQTRKAQRQTELESRRKGLMLLRKEQQLSLLNGLGRQMDAAGAAEDLAHFLVKESVRLTGAQSILLLFGDVQSEITKVISPSPPQQWGLKEGERVPRLAPCISAKEPWFAPMWRGKQSFLTCKLGHDGWLVMAREDKDAFPSFLEDFFSAVGRHAGSAILALRRLNEVRAIALREAQEKQNVEAEKEKVAYEKERVAEQNRNLRLLLEGFEDLTQGTLASDQELQSQASRAFARLTGAEIVLFQARPLEEYPRDAEGLVCQGKRWLSHLFCAGNGFSGNLLCLSRQPNAFNPTQLEWCTLLQDFLDKTMENSNLHRELQTSYAQLQRSQQEIVISSQWAAAGRLAANAAHELNTPLGAVRIAAEHISLYLHHGGKVEPAIESMESLMNSVEKCRRVTDRLLLTSRPVDQGAMPLKPQVEPLAPILKEVAASMQPYLRMSKVQLVMPDPLPNDQGFLVMQDLYWALVNLIKNSIDAINETNSPEKKIFLTLEARPAEHRLSLTLSDTGPGVPEQVKARLFEPFFTTKKLGQGNGLGLSMSRTNLRRWEGDIEFLDTAEGGATFVLKVPLP
jgi:C4-dicarboxylate-specific signal transduction histidine kinase